MASADTWGDHSRQQHRRHLEPIAERLVRLAKLGVRQSVVAGADCGSSSQATSSTEVHPTVVGLKFAAPRDCARLASKQLWTWG